MGNRILLIEDESDVAELIKEVLEFENYSVDAVRKGDEGLARIQSEKYDVVFLDIRLEGRVSGIDVIQALKDVPNRPKIFVVSALPKCELERSLKEINLLEQVERVLEKPEDVKPGNLVRILQKTLAT